MEPVFQTASPPLRDLATLPFSRCVAEADALRGRNGTASDLNMHWELSDNDSCYCPMLRGSMFTNPTLRAATSAAVFLFFVGYAGAQGRTTVGSAPDESPFAQLAGGWAGGGTIDLAGGRHEPIKCRASYDVLETQSKLQLNLHCASESYNFDLRASATYSGDSITGTWNESTRNAAGSLSGKVEGAGFHVVAKGQTFRADLNLVTQGNKQSVTIRSQDEKADVQGATITLQRG